MAKVEEMQTPEFHLSWVEHVAPLSAALTRFCERRGHGIRIWFAGIRVREDRAELHYDPGLGQCQVRMQDAVIATTEANAADILRWLATRHYSAFAVSETTVPADVLPDNEWGRYIRAGYLAFSEAYSAACAAQGGGDLTDAEKAFACKQGVDQYVEKLDDAELLRLQIAAIASNISDERDWLGPIPNAGTSIREQLRLFLFAYLAEAVWALYAAYTAPPKGIDK